MSSIRLSPLQRSLLIMLCLLLLTTAWMLWELHHFLHTAPAQTGKNVVVRIEQGMSFSSIAALLEKQGIITDKIRFALLGRAMSKTGSVRAGECLLNTGWRPLQVLAELGRCGDILVPLTIPEGLSWWQTANIIQNSGLGTQQGFARIIKDPDFLKKWKIPATSAEGYLFPETYFFPKTAQKKGHDTSSPPNTTSKPLTDEQNRLLADHLAAMFWKKVRKIIPPNMPPKELHKLLTLASLVEKETSRDEERARIAGVYANRLKKHMRLQCDPTVIYGIGPGFDGNLTRKHLRDRSNIYNTYTHNGLPPGPICSPGLASLKAALHPEIHAYLYFVARGDSSHVFSKTLKQHNRYVRKYQKHR